MDEDVDVISALTNQILMLSDNEVALRDAVMMLRAHPREREEAFSKGFEAGFFCGQKADPTGPLTQRTVEAATQAWVSPEAPAVPTQGEESE